MKLVHKSTMTLALILFSTSMIGAQDLSKYRNLSLGTSVASISKQVDATPNQFTVIHQSPVLIQELTWWPVATSESDRRAETVEQVKFSFCNRELYKIEATYEDTATKGLTADDMVQAISATYGTATRPTADLSAPAHRVTAALMCKSRSGKTPDIPSRFPTPRSRIRFSLPCCQNS